MSTPRDQGAARPAQEHLAHHRPGHRRRRYSGLLIMLNKRLLPTAIRPKAHLIAALGWAVLAFGVLSALTIVQQGAKLV